MFGFSMHEMETTGSADRFPIRVENFKKKKKALPVLQHSFWWFVHNCITHPLIGICPIKPLFQFHDWTSVKLTAGTPAITTEIEELQNFEKQLLNMRDGLHEINGGEPSTTLDIVQSAYFAVHNDIVHYRRQERLKKRK